MKKFIVFSMLILLAGLNFSFMQSELFYSADKSSIDYEIISKKNNQFLIKISSDDIDRFLVGLGLQNVSQNFTCDRMIIEGYTEMISNSININSRKINIQVSVFDDYALVGSPLIYDSFWNDV